GSIYEERIHEFSKKIGRRIQVFSTGGGMFSSFNKLHMAENMVKDLKKYADMDIDELLGKLSEEELEQLGNMVDPDDSLIPPSERCRTQTKKKPTGPLNRRHLLQFLEKFAREQEDWPEAKTFQSGTKRGKVFVPRIQPKPKQDDDVEVELDIGEDYEKALNTANESELVDLAASIFRLLCDGVEDLSVFTWAFATFVRVAFTACEV
ncbi:hypothetical protein HPB47_026660, partial [Ixodes persulcatus]